MVGEFMVYVDRIIASGASEGVDNEFVRRDGDGGGGGGGEKDNGPTKYSDDGNSMKRTKKKGESFNMIECRICQEEGEEAEMEAPCACNGTLKVFFFSAFLF